ncbi:MAG: anaerobic ribonucleoside-triphosphate reductase activating protein [Fusobacteriaceae bacterium]
MRVISESKNDAVNSVSGFTYSIFFSGCSHKCEGCFSPQTWNHSNGYEVSLDLLKEKVLNSRHNNVSLIGGDPLFEDNRVEVIELIKWIKSNTNKKVYVWTGYEASEVSKWIDLSLIDYLIDGKFEIGKLDIRLVLRGSSNQRIYKNGIESTKEFLG